MPDGFTIRDDIERAVVGEFAFPLGIVPDADAVADPPRQGYTVDYTPGRDDEPDTYVFLIMVSHEALPGLLGRAFALLPADVVAIFEIGSRDAYRALDVYLSSDSMSREDFLLIWQDYEEFLLEDGSVAAGANADDPFIEVFLDRFKRLAIHVPVSMREDIEVMLADFGVGEVPRLWPESLKSDDDGDGLPPLTVRPILQLDSPYDPDVDELLLELRERWSLELNIDPAANLDEAGRELGLTLWHAVLILTPAPGQKPKPKHDGAYAFVWATAASLMQIQQLIDDYLESQPKERWKLEAIYTIDRVAYDERPEELTDQPPRPEAPGIHLFKIEPWDGADKSDA